MTDSKLDKILSELSQICRLAGGLAGGVEESGSGRFTCHFTDEVKVYLRGKGYKKGDDIISICLSTEGELKCTDIYAGDLDVWLSSPSKPYGVLRFDAGLSNINGNRVCEFEFVSRAGGFVVDYDKDDNILFISTFD